VEAPVADDRNPLAVYGVGEEPDPRFSLANERTALAWVRTALAFVAILVGGLCGGLIGYSVTDLQCTSGCGGAKAGLGALIGALLAAGGVAVVAVLVLRAMAEWRTIQHRQE
jgi:putative membrane protein